MKPKSLLPWLAALALAAGGAAAVYWFAFRPSSPVPDGGSQGSEQSRGERPFPYDVEYPAVGYRQRTPTARAAKLATDLAAGRAELQYELAHGYLESLLRALDIDPASQVLVFSKTSLQAEYIGPKTPRAIYFNDDTYVAYEPGAPLIEIGSMDADLGAVFYALGQSRAVNVRMPRETTRCLRCHDTYELSGGGVPRFLLGSGYIGKQGQLISHEGWILTTDRTPLSSRWGGWYVTGKPEGNAHLGNLVVGDPASLQHLDSLRVGTLRSLDGLLDTSPYIRKTSDIVALLVLQHQTEVQDLIVRASFDARQALAHTDSAALSPAAQKTIDDDTEALLRAMLFVDAAPIEHPIAGSSGFAKAFEGRGPRDAEGRSLRQLALDGRLFRYPMSYLVYSQAFDGLPAPVLARFYARLANILRGRDTSGDFASLSAADRSAVAEILVATKPDFAAVYQRRPKEASVAGSTTARAAGARHARRTG